MKTLAGCYALLLTIATVVAQPITTVEHFTLNKGLNSREVLSMTRDDDGLFWLFNEYKVQKYDGKSFQTFAPEQFINFTNYHETLAADKRLYRVSQDRKTLVSLDISAPSESIPVEKFIDHHGAFRIIGPNIYNLTSDHKVQEYKLTKDRDEVELDGIPIQGEVMDLYYRDEELWYINQEGQLYHYNRKMALPDLIAAEVFMIIGYNQDALWYQTTNKEIHTNNEDVQLDFYKNKTPFRVMMFYDQSNQTLLALGNSSQSIQELYISSDNSEFKAYPSVVGLQANISELYSEDFSSKLFSCTYNGLYLVHFNKVFENLFIDHEVKADDFGNTVIGLCQSDRDSTIYFSEGFEGLFQYRNGEIKKLLPNEAIPNAFIPNNLNMIYDKSRDRLLSINGRKGIYFLDVYNIQDNSFQKIPIDFIPRSLRIFDKELWMFGENKETNQGIVRVYGLDQLETPLAVLNTSARVNYIAKTHQGFWLGQSDGLYRMPKNAFHTDSIQPILKDIPIMTFLENDNMLLVGTNGLGVILLENGKEISRINNENNGLSNEVVEFIFEDLAGDYWIGTRAGLALVNSEFELVHNFLMKDGISNKEFDRHCVIQGFDGKIYAGTINGLTVFEPEAAKRSIKNTIRIKPTDFGFFKDGFYQKTLPISYNPEFLDIQFQVSDYMLNDQDPKWKYIYKANSTIDEDVFTVLDNAFRIYNPKSGKRQIEIMEKINASGMSVASSMDIKVKGFLEEYFLVMALLFLSGSSLYLLFKNRLDEMKFDQEIKEAKLKNQVEHLKSLALRSQMNPHFLFNSLGSIQYLIQTGQSESAENYLSSFGSLMRKVLESSRMETITLKEELQILKFYIQLEHLRFTHKFGYSIDVDPMINTDISIPPMIIQPFVENAILHGLNHLDQRMGTLQLEFRYLDNQSFQCTISDNGIGREAAAALRNKKPRKAHATQIVADRIKLYNQREQGTVEYRIRDIVGRDQQVQGTLVIIDFQNMPLDQKDAQELFGSVQK